MAGEGIKREREKEAIEGVDPGRLRTLTSWGLLTAATATAAKPAALPPSRSIFRKAEGFVGF